MVSAGSPGLPNPLVSTKIESTSFQPRGLRSPRWGNRKVTLWGFCRNIRTMFSVSTRGSVPICLALFPASRFICFIVPRSYTDASDIAFLFIDPECLGQGHGNDKASADVVASGQPLHLVSDVADDTRGQGVTAPLNWSL